ncbi:uncharacterized mitochondrial protein AtMg00810-like [Gossypium raimondii]|uniref:uncharacterized mitochondrial protein AtMg00810-like n=1 Tax=Gossypium raimondii TaxID=29730 RepID=UPI00227D516E|nr:uncharacterized mitochondrial protein AtMg00810-like [Gossypium raimondii]
MAFGKKLAKDDGNALSDPQHYRSIVGPLQYLYHTRPNISYSINKVAQYMQNLIDSHWVVVKRILRYLRGTLDYGLMFTSGKMMNLIACTDTDWGSDVDDRRSTSSHCVLLRPNIISWSSKKQKSISRSTVEVKYRSLADTASEIIYGYSPCY